MTNDDTTTTDRLESYFRRSRRRSLAMAGIGLAIFLAAHGLNHLEILPTWLRWTSTLGLICLIVATQAIVIFSFDLERTRSGGPRTLPSAARTMTYLFVALIIATVAVVVWHLTRTGQMYWGP